MQLPPHPPLFRAQAAVEYIIILSVVLILGTIILAITGFFPTFSYGSQVGDSIKYWQTTASPIAIIDTTQSGTTFEAVLENKASANIQITGFKLTHGTTEYNQHTLNSMPPGSKQSFSLTAQDCAGRQTLEYAVQISYNTDSVSSLVQKGVKHLFVQCSS